MASVSGAQVCVCVCVQAPFDVRFIFMPIGTKRNK